MDGLLFDTETLYEAAMLAAAEEAGHAVTPALFRQLLGGAWTHSRSLLLEHFGNGFPVEALRLAWMQHFATLVETRLVLKPGVLELLDRLDRLRLPRAIATSSSPESVEHHLAGARPRRTVRRHRGARRLCGEQTSA